MDLLEFHFHRGTSCVWFAGQIMLEVGMPTGQSMICAKRQVYIMQQYSVLSPPHFPLHDNDDPNMYRGLQPELYRSIQS